MIRLSRQQRVVFFLLPAILCLASAVWAIGGLAIQPRVRKHATVKRVVDGDTIIVTLKDGNEETVRLLCVKTEESVHPDRKRNTPFGKETLGVVKKWLPVGTKVKLQFEENDQRDKDGRLLAYVGAPYQNFQEPKSKGGKKGNRDLSMALINRGFSPYYTALGKAKRKNQRFKDAEAYARDNKLGIWSTEESTKKYLRLKRDWGMKAAALEKEKPEIRPTPASPVTTKIDSSVSRSPASAVVELSRYVASRWSSKFHHSTCRYVKSIKAGNLVKYKTRDEAVKAGKAPCRVCKP